MTSFGTSEDYGNFIDKYGQDPLSGATGKHTRVSIGVTGRPGNAVQRFHDLLYSTKPILGGGGGGGGGGSSTSNYSSTAAAAPAVPSIYLNEDFLSPMEDPNAPLPIDPKTSMDARAELMKKAWEKGIEAAAKKGMELALTMIGVSKQASKGLLQIFDGELTSKGADKLTTRNSLIKDDDGNVIGVLRVTEFGDGSRTHTILRNNQTYRDRNPSTDLLLNSDIQDLRNDHQQDMQNNANENSNDSQSKDDKKEAESPEKTQDDNKDDNNNNKEDNSDDGEEILILSSYDGNSHVFTKTDDVIFVYA